MLKWHGVPRFLPTGLGARGSRRATRARSREGPDAAYLERLSRHMENLLLAHQARRNRRDFQPFEMAQMAREAEASQETSSKSQANRAALARLQAARRAQERRRGSFDLSSFSSSSPPPPQRRDHAVDSGGGGGGRHVHFAPRGRGSGSSSSSPVHFRHGRGVAGREDRSSGSGPVFSGDSELGRIMRQLSKAKAARKAATDRSNALSGSNSQSDIKAREEAERARFKATEVEAQLKELATAVATTRLKKSERSFQKNKRRAAKEEAEVKRWHARKASAERKRRERDEKRKRKHEERLRVIEEKARRKDELAWEEAYAGVASKDEMEWHKYNKREAKRRDAKATISERRHQASVDKHAALLEQEFVEAQEKAAEAEAQLARAKRKYNGVVNAGFIEAVVRSRHEARAREEHARMAMERARAAQDVAVRQAAKAEAARLDLSASASNLDLTRKSIETTVGQEAIGSQLKLQEARQRQVAAAVGGGPGGSGANRAVTSNSPSDLYFRNDDDDNDDDDDDDDNGAGVGGGGDDDGNSEQRLVMRTISALDASVRK